jgi:hypothetical protein
MRLKVGLDDEYRQYVANNSNYGYSKGVVDFTERWVALMEAKIPAVTDDLTVQAILTMDDFGKQTGHAADTEGITGFMYGYAASALTHFWQHGEGFRRWHNLDTQLTRLPPRARSAPSQDRRHRSTAPHLRRWRSPGQPRGPAVG